MDNATIKTAHDVLDAAGVKRPDGTHPQLIDRIKMLRDERDLARAIVASMWGIMATEGAWSMCPDWLRAKGADTVEGEGDGRDQD